jgi:hypothetical protein
MFAFKFLKIRNILCGMCKKNKKKCFVNNHIRVSEFVFSTWGTKKYSCFPEFSVETWNVRMCIKYIFLTLFTFKNMFLRVDELYIHFGSSSSSFRVTIGGGLL